MARPGLTLHRKFKRLARTLDGSIQAGFGTLLARGVLEAIWEGAYEAGDDYLGDATDVEARACWGGKDGILVDALSDAGGPGAAGFIEEGGSTWWPEGAPGTYRIHNLFDHAPRYVKRRVELEAQRQQDGHTIRALRVAAGKKGAAAKWGNREATGQQADGKMLSVCQNEDGNRAPEDDKRPANGCQTMAPPAPAPAHAPAPAPSQPGEGLAGDEDETGLVLFRSTLAESLGLPQMLDVGRNPKAVLSFFREQLEAVGEDVLLADCCAVARKSTTGTPTSLAWFVGWLRKLPVRSVQ